MDPIRALRIFTRVAELSSFTQAAASLGLPKTSVSQWVQALESHVGARLLHRTTRQVQLTHDGRALYERSKDLIADVDELGSMFKHEARDLAGRIRVDMPSRMARLRVIPKLPDFVARHPDLMIELGSTDREVDLVSEGYDCVVRVGELSNSGLMAKRIGSLQIIHCASPAYLRKYGKPSSVADLTGHYLVHYAYNFGERPDGFEYWDGKRLRSVPMKGLVTVNNAEAYTAACLAGLGIIQVPNSTLEPHLRRGQLVEILPKIKAEPMPVSIVYPSKRHLSRRVRVFMDWLENALE